MIFVKKITAVLVLLLIVVSTLPIESAQAGFVQVGQVCTLIYSYIPPCPPPVVVCPPVASPVICPPDPCPPKVKCPPPKKKLDPCIEAKLGNIKREAKRQLDSLLCILRDYGWKKVSAKVDRAMTARYIYKITVSKIGDPKEKLTFYQVTVLRSGCFETFYVWSYITSRSDDDSYDMIGDLQDLLGYLDTY